MPLYILGKSPGYLALLLETLGQQNQGEVFLVDNLESPDTAPYRNDLVRVEAITPAQFQASPGPRRLCLGVGNPQTKYKVWRAFEAAIRPGDEWLNVRAASSVWASTARLGNGIYAEPGVVVSPFASIGSHVFLNRQVSIGHHTGIGDWCSLMPGTHVAGFCQVGRGTMIGAGSVVFDRVNIGANCIIGGGSVVTKDIPDGVMAWGNPCKVIKESDSRDWIH